MKGMKKILWLFVLCACILTVTESYAQHEQQYSQFMYNKLIFNPGYAGSTDDVTFLGTYRNQWMGFEGAPTSMGISVDGSLKKDKVGLGMNIFRHTIGVYDNWTMDGVYAYKIQVGPEALLSAGLQASMRYYGVNFADSRLRGTQDLGIDPAIPDDQISDLTANFGFGLYFSTPKFYAGFSVPRLLNTNVDFTDRELPLSRESRHSFFMMGGNVRLNPVLEWTPQMLIKHTSNAPIGVEVFSGFTVLERYTAGVGYRSGGLSSFMGESVDVLVGFQLNAQLFMAFSYDILISDLRNYSTGSIEAVVRYTLAKESAKPDRIINPRYF